MRYTNKHQLPQTLVNLTERDGYTKGHARISVTTLIGSPRVSILRARHDDEIEVDVADGIWALVGRALHHVAEAGADEQHLSEERLFTDVNGWTISGGIDLQILSDGVSILDYKFTSAWAVMNAEDKSDWEWQLNVYAWLVRRVKGMEVKRLQICALIRDWRRREAELKSTYPQAPAQVIDIPLWSYEQQTAFVEERVRVHQEAAAAASLEHDLPECTDEERWIRGDKWAVKKRGAKRAIRVFDSEAEANAFRGEVFDMEVEHRKGEPIRCTGNYCRVNQFCDQYQNWLVNQGGE